MVVTSFEKDGWELARELYVKHIVVYRIYRQAKQADGTYNFLEAEAFQHLDSPAACEEMLQHLHKEIRDLEAKVETYIELDFLARQLGASGSGISRWDR